MQRNCFSTPHSNFKCFLRLASCLYLRPQWLGQKITLVSDIEQDLRRPEKVCRPLTEIGNTKYVSNGDRLIYEIKKSRHEVVYGQNRSGFSTKKIDPKNVTKTGTTGSDYSTDLQWCILLDISGKWTDRQIGSNNLAHKIQIWTGILLVDL